MYGLILHNFKGIFGTFLTGSDYHVSSAPWPAPLCPWTSRVYGRNAFFSSHTFCLWNFFNFYIEFRFSSFYLRQNSLLFPRLIMSIIPTLDSLGKEIKKTRVVLPRVLIFLNCFPYNFLLVISWFHLKSLVYFEFILISGRELWIGLSLQFRDIQFPQHHLRKRLSCPKWVFLWPLSQICWLAQM